MSQYLDWKVGDKVVCVDASHRPDLQTWKTIDDSLDGLTEGRVYTIREIGPLYGEVVVHLVEIRRAIRGTYAGEPVTEEAGFKLVRFRKVQPRKTSIAIFTEMLHRAPEKVSA